MKSNLPLKPLEDDAEADALRPSLRSLDERVVFLSQDDRTLVGLQGTGDWFLYELTEQVEADQLSELLEYLTVAAEYFVEQAETGEEVRDYYSIRPLIYGGDYWLDEVCPREVNRFDALEEGYFSVVLLRWPGDSTLHSLADSLRRGDRLGYFPGVVAVACPFTPPKAANTLVDRLEYKFYLNDARRLTYGFQFHNLPELRSEVQTFR